VSSSDTPEIVALTRRCLVFQGGVISAELTGVEVTEDRILAASVGTPTAVASR
jgi:ABC-type sugar transport system ATPase subunit